jgi:hypothetical protein
VCAKIDDGPRLHIASAPPAPEFCSLETTCAMKMASTVRPGPLVQAFSSVDEHTSISSWGMDMKRWLMRGEGRGWCRWGEEVHALGAPGCGMVGGRRPSVALRAAMHRATGKTPAC